MVSDAYGAPRSLLKILSEFLEPPESSPLSISCLQHQSTTVPPWSALCACIPWHLQSGMMAFFFLIHLLDPIRAPLDWQSLTEERDLGNTSPGFPVGIQNRLEAGMTVEADSSLPHSVLQFDCFLRSYLGLDYVGKQKRRRRWCFPSRLSQSVTGVRRAPADPMCTPVTVKCSCLRGCVKRMCLVFFRTPDLIQIWRSLIWENLLFSSAFHCYFFRRTGKGVHQKMLNQKDRKQTNVQTNKKYLGLCLA